MLDRIIDAATKMSQIFSMGIPLLIVALVSCFGYLAIFLYPMEDVQGLSPEFARSMLTIVFWVLGQSLWQGVSQITGVTFGAAFQIGILAIVASMVSIHNTIGNVAITVEQVIALAVLLIGLALFDNTPRLMLHEDKPIEEKAEKKKRGNIGLFEKLSRNRLQLEDSAPDDEFHHKLDYLTNRGKQ